MTGWVGKERGVFNITLLVGGGCSCGWQVCRESAVVLEVRVHK